MQNRDAHAGAMVSSSLHYRLEGSGRRVVLLHPVGLDMTFFDPLAAELTPQCQILRVDMPGHGTSPALAGTPTLEDYAAAIDEVLQNLDYAPATVVGFSFGGMVGQVLALEYPRDVMSLVSSACLSTLPAASRKVFADRGKMAFEQGMGAVLESTLARWFTSSFRARGGDSATRERLLSDDPASWAQAWQAISQLDTAPRLGEINVPVLCLAGEADEASPPDAMRATADAIRSARMAVISGAPHMLFIEQPRAVASAIRDFLAEIPD